MSNRKTTEERITTLNKKMEPLREKLDQLEKQKEALESAKKEADRRARTHLLIQVGGVVAHYLDRELMDGDDDLLGTFLEQQEKNGHFFTRAMYRENAKPKTSPDEYERKLIAAEKSTHKNAAKTDAKEKKTNDPASVKADPAGKKEAPASAKAKTAAAEKPSAGTGVPKPTTNP